jgi:hypothetical protein
MTAGLETINLGRVTVAGVPTDPYKFLTPEQAATGLALEREARELYAAWRAKVAERNAWVLAMTRAYPQHDRTLPTALARLLDLDRAAILKGQAQAELAELRAERAARAEDAS